MKFHCLPAHELTPAHIEMWRSIQRAEPSLDSPFFCPEFVQAVAEVRDDVEVALLEDRGRVVGFLPFQRTALNVGKPVGGPLSDFHGLIAPANLACDLGGLLRACRLALWKFDNLVVAQREFAPHCWSVAAAPYMDLSRGFDTYRAGRRYAGADATGGNSRSWHKKTTARKLRKVEREVGPIRLVPHSTELDVLKVLFTWKSEQYHRTKMIDVFGFPWTVELLERLVQREATDFSAMLSALYIGDRVAAVHCGLRWRGVLHYWFPAYDTSFSRFSPGLMLLVRTAQEAQSLGIHRIDLGSGPGDFKRSVMSGATNVAQGCITNNRAAEIVRRNCWRARCWLQSSPLRLPARIAGQVARPVRGWLAFH